MPFFVSRRELSRLERELSAARKRAHHAEMRLEEERRARDTLNLAMIDHAAVREKGYAISARLPNIQEELKETQEVYHERLKLAYPEIWTSYQKFATEAGKDEHEALDWLDR